MILLISTRDTLVKAFTMALPIHVPVIHLSTTTELQAYSNSSIDNNFTPRLIVVDAIEDQQNIIYCHQWRQEIVGDDIPIVAVINQLEQREPVLEAGADDYLAYPLVPSELQARLTVYRLDSAKNMNIWLDALHELNDGASAEQVVFNGLKRMAQLFRASCSWLFLIDSSGNNNLLSSYNLPPFLQNNLTLLYDEVKTCLNIYQQDETYSPQIFSDSILVPSKQQGRYNLIRYTSILLHRHQKLIGILSFAYPELPNILSVEEPILMKLGQDLSLLLEMIRLMEEVQTYVSQNTFLILIANIPQEHLDLDAVLALSLQQSIPLLNALGGGIWLLSTDEEWLELVSSSTTGPYNYAVTRRHKKHGLLGWVANHYRPLRIDATSADHPNFDFRVDRIKGLKVYSLIAVPLYVHRKFVGVMSVYNRHNSPFSNEDIILLKSIANITALAIINIQLNQELHDYANQQQALYELSQQIGFNLDLNRIFKNILPSISRFVEAEMGLLWLAKDLQDTAKTTSTILYLADTLGLDLPEEHRLVSDQKQGFEEWVASTGKPVIDNDPTNDPRFSPAIMTILKVIPRNVMAAPLVYDQRLHGIVSFYNKTQGSFNEDDLILLSTAIEVITTHLGNANLHSQTIALLKERERLYKRLIQAERLVIAGRLTSTISHEINNPMQTLQTALQLAIQNLNKPLQLEKYLRISMEESERIAHLVSRLRQVYRPYVDKLDQVDIKVLLKEASTIARKALERKQVTLDVDLSPQLPPLMAVASQLHLVFLSLMLNLGEAIGFTEGGQLQVLPLALSHAITITFVSNASASAAAKKIQAGITNLAQTENIDRSTLSEADFGLSFCQEIISAHGGTIHIEQRKNQTIYRLELPLAYSGLMDRAKRAHTFTILGQTPLDYGLQETTLQGVQDETATYSDC